MGELDAFYARLTTLGFLVLRQAMLSGDKEWMEAELEMLHNVPSLIGEANSNRHRYYWLSERQHYIDWATQPGREEAKSRMRTYYEPIWHEMQPLVIEVISLSEGSCAAKA